jgi:hypothetical protein
VSPKGFKDFIDESFVCSFGDIDLVIEEREDPSSFSFQQLKGYTVVNKLEIEITMTQDKMRGERERRGESLQ